MKILEKKSQISFTNLIDVFSLPISIVCDTIKIKVKERQSRKSVGKESRAIRKYNSLCTKSILGIYFKLERTLKNLSIAKQFISVRKHDCHTYDR